MKSQLDFQSKEMYLEYLRTYFAAMALQGIASNRGNSENAKQDCGWIAEASVMLADALINALNETKC